MSEFIQRLVIEGHLVGWMSYILAFVERNPLSMFYSLMISGFVFYFVRRIFFGD